MLAQNLNRMSIIFKFVVFFFLSLVIWSRDFALGRLKRLGAYFNMEVVRFFPCLGGRFLGADYLWVRIYRRLSVGADISQIICGCGYIAGNYDNPTNFSQITPPSAK